MSYNASSNINEQVLMQAIVRHVTAVSNQNRVYANLFQELSEYNWRNHVMDGLIATGMEALDAWSYTRNATKESLLPEVVAVISDIQSVVSAKRNHAIMSSLTQLEAQAFQQIANMGQRFSEEIDAFMNRFAQNSGYVSPYGTMQPQQNQPINPRYAKAQQAEIRSQPEQTPTATSNTSARYRAAATTTKVPDNTSTTNNNSERHYVVSNKGNSNMTEPSTLVYENHRRSTFQTRPSDRQTQPDFMGALANDTSVSAVEPGVNVGASEITRLATDVVATCRQHAQAIYSAMITDVGNTISPDAILEYSYDEVRTVKTVADADALRIALLNDPRIAHLREIKNDLGELAKTLGELLNDPVSQLANTVARYLNLTATEQINRFVKYDLELDWNIPDFQAAYSELITALHAEFGQEATTKALDTIAADLITRVGTVFTPTCDTDSKLCDALNAIHQRDLAERSVFILRHVHVTHIPANFSALNLTFQGAECYVDPSMAPELYVALVALEERMMDGVDAGMRTFSKVLLITEDEVEMEVIPTHIDVKDGTPRKQYVLKLLKA